MTTTFSPNELLFGLPVNIFYFVLLTTFVPFILIEGAALALWICGFLFGYATVKHRMAVAPAEIAHFESLLGPDMMNPRGPRNYRR